MVEYDKKFNNREEVIAEREELFQALKDEIEITEAKDFEHYETIEDYKDLIERLEKLREIEIELIMNK